MAQAPETAGPGEGGLRVAAFRFRSTLSRQWGGYLALILIVSLLGGLALASVAGARRTQSAFPRFLKATNPSDIAIDEGSYKPTVTNSIRHLPGVTSVRSYAAFNVGVLNPKGTPDLNSAFNQTVEFVGSIDGLYFDQDRIAVLVGRRANEHRPNEAMISAQTAELFGLHVGSTLPVGFYSNQQFAAPGFNLATTSPYHSLTLHVVGIGEFADEVVQDDVDKIPRVLLTPALTRQFLECCTTYAWNGVQLRSGSAGVPALERAYSAHIPKGYPVYVRVNSVVEAQGERAVKPQSVALGVFGIIVGLAALVLASQAVSRLIGQLQAEHVIMRSLGATRRQLMSDSLVGLLTAVVLGALGAAVTAVALSPISPIGAVRRVEVSPGVSFDWTILLGGIAAFCAVPGVVALASSYRSTLQKQALGRPSGRQRANGVMRSAIAGLPIAAVAGIHLALDAGRSRNHTPVRSAIVGTALAVLTLTSAVTFGASLNTLVGHPNLYGWNWTGALIAGAGYGDVPGQEAARQLAADKSIEAWNGIYVGALEIDHHLVPTAGAIKVRARVNPPILSGHPLEARDEVVVGAATLAELHKEVGDTVSVSNSISTRTMRIVGTATMPTVGVGHGLHLSMGSGAWVYYDELPAPARNIQQNALHGPNILLVRYASGVTPEDSSRDLANLAQRLSTYNPTHVNPATLPGISPVMLERPAEIVNYRSMGGAPVLFGAGLTIGAAFALAVMLATSVRQRRRELALLKSLGFTQGQLRATVAWQSSVVVAIGTAVGIPLGIASGRALWSAFAHELHVVSDPTVPVLWIGLIAVGSLLLANLVAAVPGRSAGRTPAALVLREE